MTGCAPAQIWSWHQIIIYRYMKIIYIVFTNVNKIIY